MSNARLIFDEFVTGGAQAIAKTIEHPAREENLYLDFKQATEGHGPMVLGDRQTLAEAVSGFANSDGGVIVWGIKCSSVSKEDPDVASNLKPIGKLRLFLGDLQKCTAESVAPGVIGVEHRAIEDIPGSDQGYIVTYVPKSDVPQMARAKDQHRFYFRSGSSFLKMEPFMLADRYSRRPQPKLELRCEAGFKQNPVGVGVIAELNVGIHNSGLGLALYPAIEIKRNSLFFNDEYGIDGNRNFGLPPISVGAKKDSFFAGGADRVIYPNRMVWVTKLKTKPADENDFHFDKEKTTVFYSIFCDGYSVSGELTLNLEMIVRQARGRMIDVLDPEYQSATNRIIVD